MGERTTVRLPRDLLNRAKRKAAAEGCTLTSLIAEGLRLAIVGARKTAKEKRVLPPVSKATGGLLPGIDLMDAQRLQQADDVVYIGHLKQS
jgi:hypothetical protein